MADNQMPEDMKDFLTDFAEANDRPKDIRWAAEEAIRLVMRVPEAVITDRDVLDRLRKLQANRRKR